MIPFSKFRSPTSQTHDIKATELITDTCILHIKQVPGYSINSLSLGVLFMCGADSEMPSTGSPLELASTTSSCKPFNSAAKPMGPSYLFLVATEDVV